MNQHRFDALKSVPSRRDVLRGLGGVGIGLGALQVPAIVDAKKKRKRKKRKAEPTPPTPNAYGCLDVGTACNGDSAQCCSGICEGAKPKKGEQDASRCVGHDAGICVPDSDTCATGEQVRCHPEKRGCLCVQTTGNAAFCGDFTRGAEPYCRECSRDRDCQVVFGAGAACVVLDGACSTQCPGTGHTACVPACSGYVTS